MEVAAASHDSHKQPSKFSWVRGGPAYLAGATVLAAGFNNLLYCGPTILDLKSATPAEKAYYQYGAGKNVQDVFVRRRLYERLVQNYVTKYGHQATTLSAHQHLQRLLANPGGYIAKQLDRYPNPYALFNYWRHDLPSRGIAFGLGCGAALFVAGWCKNNGKIQTGDVIGLAASGLLTLRMGIEVTRAAARGSAAALPFATIFTAIGAASFSLFFMSLAKNRHMPRYWHRPHGTEGYKMDGLSFCYTDHSRFKEYDPTIAGKKLQAEAWENLKVATAENKKLCRGE
jgi:hypothetical protein